MLDPPFPAYGGKSRAAGLVWELLGQPGHYVEPFCRTAAVALAAPPGVRLIVVNDLDSMVSNFWRALQSAPDEVAGHADFPASHDDLAARREWLRIRWPDLQALLQLDPFACSPMVAGWWAWGVCHSIDLMPLNRPPPAHRRLYLEQLRQAYRAVESRATGGGGAATAAATGGRIDYAAGSQPIAHSGRGIAAKAHRDEYRYPWGAGLRPYLRRLAERTRSWLILNKDAARILKSRSNMGVAPAETGLAAAFIDPPYEADRRSLAYGHDAGYETRQAVDALLTPHPQDGLTMWQRPNLRIVIAAYARHRLERRLPGARVYPWQRQGGMEGTGQADRQDRQEVLIANPQCLTPGDQDNNNIQLELMPTP